MDLLAETADFQSNYFSKKEKADNDFANQLIISASNQRSLRESNPQLVLRSYTGSCQCLIVSV